MIPSSLTVHTRFGHGRRLRMWIPLFLVWLLLLPIVLILFPVVCLVCLFVRVNAVRLYLIAWQILRSLRDTLIEVENDEMAFQVRII
jgi:hypothetical protein